MSMYDGKEISVMLAAKAEAVCNELLPSGKRVNDQWATGDVRDGDGESLKVQLTGSKAGVWKDFGEEGSSGDLIGLWMAVRNVKFAEAMDEIKRWLGLPEGDTLPRARKVLGVKKPETKKGTKTLSYKPVGKGGKVWSWLVDRGIEPDTIRKFEIGESEKDGNHFVVFPFFDERGNLVRLKGRCIEEKGRMWQWPKKSLADEFVWGAPTLLWGRAALSDTATRVCIAEGEIDAMSLSQRGMECLSLPEGAQATDGVDDGQLSKSHRAWLEHDYDWLSSFTEVVLAFDTDEAGQKAAEQVAPRIGLHRVRVVRDWGEGCKDANEAMIKGFDLSRCITRARGMDPERLHHASDYHDEIMDEFFHENDAALDGLPTPFNWAYRVRMGELTLVHGYDGAGKTVWLTYLVGWLCSTQGERSCMASLEMPPQKTYRNSIRQLANMQHPDRPTVGQWIDWLDEHVFVYGHLGAAPVEDVLQTFEYAFRKYGCRLFVLDSLTMLEVEGDDYDDQKRVMMQLKRFVESCKVHVFLVAHDRKSDSRKPKSRYWPDKEEVRGGSQITNLAYNVIGIARKTEKTEKLEDADFLERSGQVQDAHEIRMLWEKSEDAMAVVHKQRETGELPMKRLWFSKESWRYRETM